MDIREIGTRGVIFTYEDDISVYLIKGAHHFVFFEKSTAKALTIYRISPTFWT